MATDQVSSSTWSPMTIAPADEPARYDDEQVGRYEHGDRRDDRPRDPVDEITGERRHDHYWPRADQAHRHGVDKLGLGEPAVVVDQPLVQERDDGEPRSERER